MLVVSKDTELTDVLLTVMGYYTQEEFLNPDVNSNLALQQSAFNVESKLKAARHYENTEQYKEAFQWYVDAANEEQPDAQVKVGNYYLEGKGVQPVGTWQFDTAKNLIDSIAGNGWRVPNDIIPQEYKGA